MRLNDKLASLTPDNTVAELNHLLDRAQVSIGWWGERLVTVEGYEDSILIQELAKKYLEASPFKQNERPSLKERLDCYELWERVSHLYVKSEEELEDTLLFNFLTPILECGRDPMAILREGERGGLRQSLFQFPPDHFLTLWPNTNACEISSTSGSELGEKWLATEKMVREAFIKFNST